VLTVIVTITARGLYAVLTVIVTIMTITGRYICSANSYCDNNDNNGEVLCDANSYCDNNGEVYMHCYQVL
jgi:hypothetical protein